MTGLVIAFLVALVASFAHGALSFGYAMIAMAILPLFLPYVESAAVVQFVLVLVTAQVTFSLRKHINWHVVLIPSLILTVGKVLGIVLLMNVEARLISLLLGIFLILYSANYLFMKRKYQIKGTPLQGAAIALVSGLFGGMFNISGPFSYIYFNATSHGDPKECAACINFNFVPAACAGLVTHILYGNYTPSVLKLGAVSVAGVLLGTMLGVALFKRIDPDRMSRIMYAYVGVMGVIICLGG